MNTWDAARHGERKQVVAALAVCEIFLRGPDGWQENRKDRRTVQEGYVPARWALALGPASRLGF